MWVPDQRPQEAREAIASLLPRVRPKMVRVLARYRIPPQDADDLVQEVLLSLVSSWNHVRDPEGWVLGVLKVRCANYWRRKKHALCEFVDEALLEALAGTETSQAAKADLAHDLGRVVAGLPPRCQNLFHYRYQLGCSPREAAERLGYRASGMSHILNRCLTALTKRLVAVGFIEERQRA